MSTTYQPEYLPATTEIADAFDAEIRSLGGTVHDMYSDARTLFARAVLPSDAEVRVGDTIRAGVAVTVRGAAIDVCPYTYRQVCTNGAIVAQPGASQSLTRIQSTSVVRPDYGIAVALLDLQNAVRACAAPEHFSASMDQMRVAASTPAATVLNHLPMFMQARLPEQIAMRELSRIFRRFSADGDHSAFGLVNAVTSIARDTRDHSIRWTLEELGGALLAHLATHSPTPQLASALRE